MNLERGRKSIHIRCDPISGFRNALFRIVVHRRIRIIVNIAENIDQRALMRILIGWRCAEPKQICIVAIVIVMPVNRK